jgi:hypothetical protein
VPIPFYGKRVDVEAEINRLSGGGGAIGEKLSMPAKTPKR